MHSRCWSWFHQRCKNFEGTRTPLYPLYILDHTVFYFDMARQECTRIVGQKAATPSQRADPLIHKMGSSVTVKESCIFHCPHWMVLRLPRTSLVMVGRAASRCTVCHHCHNHHSSKMMRTLDTNQRKESQTCHVLSIYISRPAEIDSQHLQANVVCFQLSNAASSFSKKMDSKATNTSSTETLRKQARDTNETNLSLEVESSQVRLT